MLKYLEVEVFHIAYQYDSSQLWVLMSRFLDTSVPDLQDLVTSLLDI